MRSLQLLNLVRATISAQILVATLLLAAGEASWILPILSGIALGTSIYLVDIRQRFHLGQRSADLLALAIMFLTALAALRTDRQGLLVLVANLQAYLQYVLLFQKKTARIYWQLSLLALGQVAIGSTLLPGPLFGTLLTSYLLLGVFGFALLLLYGETSRLARSSVVDKAIESRSKSERILLQGSALPIESRMLWRGLLPTTALVCLMTILAGGVLFLSLPRWSTANYEAANSDSPLRTVGFSDTVILGELGEVIENPDIVMRVKFYRGRGTKAIQLENEPLFRGTVLTSYEDRVWSQPLSSHSVELPTEAGRTITRQVITIQPLDAKEIFYVAPAFSIDGPDNRLRLDVFSEQLSRPDELRSRVQEFDIGTTGIRGDRQRIILPCMQLPRSSRIRSMLLPFVRSFPDGELGEEVSLEERPEGVQQFPRLSETAASILDDLGIDPRLERARAAQALSSYFHGSNEFVYSLEPQVRTEGVDPLEDFISDHKAGHCEYFAGALVLMLRSVGIPARMVVGFKGGEWNDLGSYYQVQQLHAHAWVEAFLEPDQIPPEEFAGEEQPPGAWLVLDPTEGTREGAAFASTGLIAKTRQLIDYGRVQWINYVASLNAKRQRQGIYEPLAAGIDAAIDNLTSVEVWQARLTALESSPVGKFWAWYRRHWFSWRGGLVAVGFSMLLVLLAISIRGLLRLLWRRGWLGKAKSADSVQTLEMYRRLETALGRAGLRRQPTQTAREFARFASDELAARFEHRTLADLPGRIVTAFYQVRFGGRTLDKPEAEAVERALAELELALVR